MELLINESNNIDKANHLIEFHFRISRSPKLSKSVIDYVNMVYRNQLISTTYNNCACLYKKRGKLQNALKWLYRALKADKELMILFNANLPVRITTTNSQNKELSTLRLTYQNRNSMASTYLNIWAVLSLLQSHERAMHMVQKAIEMITQNSQDLGTIIQ